MCEKRVNATSSQVEQMVRHNKLKFSSSPIRDRGANNEERRTIWKSITHSITQMLHTLVNPAFGF